MSDPAFFSVRSCTEKRKRRCRVGGRPFIRKMRAKISLSAVIFHLTTLWKKSFWFSARKEMAVHVSNSVKALHWGWPKMIYRASSQPYLCIWYKCIFTYYYCYFSLLKVTLWKIKERIYHMFLNQKNFLSYF